MNITQEKIGISFTSYEGKMFFKRKMYFVTILTLSFSLVLAACSLTKSTGLSHSSSPASTASPTRTTPSSPTPVTSTAAEATTVPSGEPTSTQAASSLPVTGLSTGNFATAIRDVAEKVRPAIVQITNEQSQLNLYNQPFTVPAGVGSGIIYDSKGLILTNDHVVAGATKLLVTLPDNRTFTAKILGEDPQTDLAVLQIQGNNLPVVQLGNSHQLQIGDWVIAIGNALALPGGPTVSAGVVSALGRTLQEPGASFNQPGPYLFDLIQTDAPINPGNSGGLLVNLDGQVVGINTIVAGQAEPGVQAQGIGFAIAIDTAKPIADQLVATGRAIHPYTGFQSITLNQGIAAQLGITQTQGIVIVNVAAGSPADQAGLQQYDVITSINGKPLQGNLGLAQTLETLRPGDIFTLSGIRNGKPFTTKLKLGVSPAS